MRAQPNATAVTARHVPHAASLPHSMAAAMVCVDVSIERQCAVVGFSNGVVRFVGLSTTGHAPALWRISDLYSHTARVSCAVCNDALGFAVTGSEDGTAHVWSLSKTQFVRSLVHTAPVVHCASSNTTGDIVTVTRRSGACDRLMSTRSASTWCTFRTDIDGGSGKSSAGAAMFGLDGASGVDGVTEEWALHLWSVNGEAVASRVLRSGEEPTAVAMTAYAIGCEANAVVVGRADGVVAIYSMLDLAHGMCLCLYLCVCARAKLLCSPAPT